MNALKDYVEWKLTHPQGYKSRNLFDKDNFVVQNYNLSNTFRSTDTGISYKIIPNPPASSYANLVLKIGLASEFVGKTLFLSSTSFYTSATKLSVRKGISQVYGGTNFTQSGDLFFSKITVEERDYTNEVITILLYARNGMEGGTLITYDNIMVHEGTEPLTYEPYGEFIKK